MKKKYGLFKVLSVLLLLVVIVSYFINGREGAISHIALGDVFVNYMQSFYYFFETALFILIIGGFYGFVNRVPAYKKLIKMIVKKVKNKSLLFVIITTVVFALISSFTGLNTILLVVIPFVVSIILLLGYDKLVALSATIGGSLVGFIGGVFVTFKDASSQYAVEYTTFDKMAGLDGNWSLILPKVLLLFVATGLLIFYIVNHIKKVEEKAVKYNLSKGDNLYIEPRDKMGKKIKVDYSGVKVWPIIVCFCCFVVLLILGYFPWKSLFGLKIFGDFHTFLTSFTFAKLDIFILPVLALLFIYNLYKANISFRKDSLTFKLVLRVLLLVVLLWLISIFGIHALEIGIKSGYGKWVSKLSLWNDSFYTSVISGNFAAFGEFGSIGSFMGCIILLIILIIALKFIYKIDFEDVMDGFIYGVKKLIPTVVFTMLAYSVLVCAYNNGFMETIITNCSKSYGDNVVVFSVVSLFGSIFNVDLYYSVAGIFTNIVSKLTEKANLKVYALMFQSLYGFVQLGGPTSLMLIFGLSYLEVPYKTWMKYIWRFLVGLLISILIILMIVSLL